MIDPEDIRSGLENEEFLLKYQPIVLLNEPRCVGAEALVRWQRPDGLLLPNEFIPLIEQTPLAGLLTYWVIERAATELGSWLRTHSGIELHINVPPEILGRGGLEYAAQKAGLSDVNEKIVMEITERGLPDHLGLKALDAAARKGVRIALDDVRIDPANVLVLARSNAQIIKVDQGVLLDADCGAVAPSWRQALAVLVKTTDLDVIVEGVETREQAMLLRNAGVRRVQGNYFSPPLPPDAFLHYFEHASRLLKAALDFGTVTGTTSGRRS